MPRRRAPVVLFVAFATMGLDFSPAAAERFALLPVEDRAGEPVVARAVEEVLRSELERRGGVVAREETRSQLRRLRLRRLEDATPDVLARLGSELEVDRLVGATVHEVWQTPLVGVTLAGRVIEVRGGPKTRHALVSGTGIDGMHWLGLGVEDELVPLVESQTLTLLDRLGLTDVDSAAAPAAELSGAAERREAGRVAVIPLTSPLSFAASAAAAAGTDAVYAALEVEGAEPIAENAVATVMRRQRVERWGELDAETRAFIARELGAELILTGSVEAYEAGWGTEPRPEVFLALRALDAQSGRIVWHGSLERDGWYRQRPFRRGRVLTRGGLLQELSRRLVRDLLDSEAGSTIRQTER